MSSRRPSIALGAFVVQARRGDGGAVDLGFEQRQLHRRRPAPGRCGSEKYRSPSFPRCNITARGIQLALPPGSNSRLSIRRVRPSRAATRRHPRPVPGSPSPARTGPAPHHGVIGREAGGAQPASAASTRRGRPARIASRMDCRVRKMPAAGARGRRGTGCASSSPARRPRAGSARRRSPARTRGRAPSPDHRQLLVVLAPEHRDVGLRLVEQPCDHGRDAVEMPGRCAPSSVSPTFGTCMRTAPSVPNGYIEVHRWQPQRRNRRLRARPRPAAACAGSA